MLSSIAKFGGCNWLTAFLRLSDNDIRAINGSWNLSASLEPFRVLVLGRAAEINLPFVAEVARLWTRKPISGEIGDGKFSSAARLEGVSSRLGRMHP